MGKLAITRSELESMLTRVLRQTLAGATVVVAMDDRPKPKPLPIPKVKDTPRRETDADLGVLDPLTRKVAHALGLHRYEAIKAVRAVFEALAEVLKENVDTPGFHLRVHALGIFRARHFEARNRSNPRTNLVSRVPAQSRLGFKFTLGLRNLGKP